MLTVREGLKVFLRIEPTDMRKAIDGLCTLIVDDFKEEPQSGHLFIFYNQSKNKVKVIYWNRTRFVLHYKRLEKGKFMFSKTNAGTLIEISDNQLQWLLAGLDFQIMHQYSELNYSHNY